MFKKIAFVAILAWSSVANAKQKEADYVNAYCQQVNGIIEHRLADSTRVDCFVKKGDAKIAMEFDFAHKWAECIGQAYHYGLMTDSMPVCALIMTKPDDVFYEKRVRNVAEFYQGKDGQKLGVIVIKDY
jgi:hypothetical protein